MIPRRAQEEAEVTEKRPEALAEARASGDFGQKIAATIARNRLGRVEAPELELRRLGARGRFGSTGALRLPAHDALRRARLRRALSPHPGSRSRSPMMAARPGTRRYRSASATARRPSTTRPSR